MLDFVITIYKEAARGRKKRILNSMGNRRGKIKRMNKKDSEVEEEIGVAAIAKVERMRLFGRLKRPKL